MISSSTASVKTLVSADIHFNPEIRKGLPRATAIYTHETGGYELAIFVVQDRSKVAITD